MTPRKMTELNHFIEMLERPCDRLLELAEEKWSMEAREAYVDECIDLYRKVIRVGEPFCKDTAMDILNSVQSGVLPEDYVSTMPTRVN